MARSLSFQALCERDCPNKKQVLSSLKCYATGGYGISAKTVIEIIEKSNFSEFEFLMAYGYACVGLAIQQRKGKPLDVVEYSSLIFYLETNHNISAMILKAMI